MPSRVKGRILSACVAFAMLGLPSVSSASSFELNIVAPDFIIPLAGKDGTLTVYSDGRQAETTGFDALGPQTFTLWGNSTSTGYLTLNLFFSGFPLGMPDQVINDASIQFTVRDFDFISDQVTRQITLTEMAILKAVNGDPLVAPINLASYLPVGTTTTDERTITLRPIDLMPPLSSGDFTDPFILSLRLSAVAKNTGYQAVTLMNTQEGIFTGISLKGDFSPRPVPEPATGLLLALGVGLGTVAKYRKNRLERSTGL